MSSACSRAIGSPAVGPCHVARRGSCAPTSSNNCRSCPGLSLSAWLPRGGCTAAAGSLLPSHAHRSSALTCPRFLVGRCSSGSGSGSAMLVRRSELRSATWRPKQSTRGREKRSMGGKMEVSAHSKSADNTNAAVAVGRRMRGGESGTVFVSASSGSESSARNGVTSTTTSVATPAGSPVPPTTSPSYPGSPLVWVGVGVAISVIFLRIAKEVEKRSAALQRAAMQQILKSMVGGPSGTSAPPFGMPPFPMPPSPLGIPPQAFTPPAPPPPQPSITIESSPSSTTSTAGVAESTVSSEGHEASSVAAAQRKPAFTDVSPDAMGWEGGSKPAEEGKGSFFHAAEVVDSNASSSGSGSSQTEGAAGAGAKESVFTVEALEKMMEDPMVQKMVYPYLPEEMRNPATFKWMLQNPQYRQQLQDMLGNMGGDAAWDGRMADMMKNFNLSSNEVKQQFDQIGMTPEDVISKIMANPDIAVAFQSPKVQAAIMDCSQNPLNISKYQNDREVMDVFSRISELFPGMT